MSFGANRSVAVTLKANVADYIGKVTAAKKATTDFAGDVVKHAGKHRQAWDQVGKGMLVAGTVIALGVGLAVKSYMDFDKELSNVRAVSGATSGQMNLLSDAALKAGAATKFSAREAAQAEGELAKVGISVADILGGALLGSLNLAAAGNLDLGRAAEISGQAMKMFKLEGKDVGRIADVLASGANKSAADVEQLAQALAQGGLVAAQTGLTLEDTVGTLAAFADNALMGADGGTSLKTMLLALNPQSKEAATLMKELGLSAYDSQGQFIGIAAYAGKLQTALSGLSTEQRNATLQTIFGRDAIRGAQIAYELGAAGIQKYVDGVIDQGAAARVAAINMDNLSGDLEQLRGSIETALIQAGSAGNGVLRDMVQAVTGAVNAFGELPKPLQQGVLGLAAVAAGVLLLGGGFLVLVPKIAATKTALVTLGVTARGVGAFMMGPFGVALAAGALAVGWFAKSQMDAKARADDLRGSLDQTTGAITDQTRVMVSQRLESEGVLETYRHLAGGLENLTNAALGQQDALDRLHSSQEANKSQMDALVAKHGDLTQAEYDQLVATTEMDAAYGRLFKILGETTSVLNPQVDAQKRVGEAAGTSSGQVKTLTVAQQQLKDATDAAREAVDKQVGSLQEAGLAVLSTRAAQRELIDAQLASTAALKANGAGLSINTAKGRENAAALDNQASKALSLAKAIYDETGSEASMRASLDKSRSALIATGVRFGLTKAQAQAYADKVLGIPKTATTTVTAFTAAASAAVAGLTRQIVTLNGQKATIYVDTVKRTFQQATSVGLTAPKSTTLYRRAAGGTVGGTGGPTADDQLMWASTGEEVINAAASARWRPLLKAINAGQFADGGTVDVFHRLAATRFATGVTVPPATQTTAPAGAPTVYVQNPFTGKYLLAKVTAVADERAGAAITTQSRRILQGAN